jgi:hypothetical protein
VEIYANICYFRELSKFVGELDNKPARIPSSLITLDVLLVELLPVEIDLPLVVLAADSIGFSGRCILQDCLRRLGLFGAVSARLPELDEDRLENLQVYDLVDVLQGHLLIAVLGVV